MKTKLSFIISFLIFSLILTTSCSKDEISFNNEENTDLLKIAENPLNPYDYIGIQHNILLDKIKTNTGQTHPKFVSFVEYEIAFKSVQPVQSYIPTRTEETALESQNEPIIIDQEDLKNIMDDRANNLYQTIEDLLIDDYSKEQLHYYMSEICNPDIAKGNLLFEGYFYTKTEEFEKMIIESSVINENDKAIILKATSVARHSFAYWNNEAIKNPITRGFWQDLVRVVTFVGADVGGLMYGGLDGALFCSGAAGFLLDQIL